MHAKPPKQAAQLYTSGQFSTVHLRPPIDRREICRIGKGSRRPVSSGQSSGQFDEPASHSDGGLDVPRSTRRSEARRPFTDRFLASLKPAADRYDVVDPARKGLLIRVTPNGVKTFYFRYQRNLRPVRLMIGRYPATTLKVAYETHGDLVRRLNRGEDIRVVLPPGVRSIGVAHAPLEATLTVGDLAKEFCERYLYRERKNPREAELGLAISGKSTRRSCFPQHPEARRETLGLRSATLDEGAAHLAAPAGLSGALDRRLAPATDMHTAPAAPIRRPVASNI